MHGLSDDFCLRYTYVYTLAFLPCIRFMYMHKIYIHRCNKYTENTTFMLHFKNWKNAFSFCPMTPKWPLYNTYIATHSTSTKLPETSLDRKQTTTPLLFNTLTFLSKINYLLQCHSSLLCALVHSSVLHGFEMVKEG